MSEHVTMAEHFHKLREFQDISLHYEKDMANVERIMMSDLSSEIHFTDGSVFRMQYGLISPDPHGGGEASMQTPRERGITCSTS